MMKKLLIIIFAFVGVVVNAQYQTPDTLWNGTINVVGSDTLLYDSVNATNTGIKLIKYKGALNVGYLSLDEYGFLIINEDTLSLKQCASIGFRNYNDADTLFFQSAGYTRNSDSTKNLPSRLTRIARYSTPTADINDYWQQVIKPDNANVYTVCASGCDYATHTLANASVPLGDTIFTKSGTYIESDGSTANFALRNSRKYFAGGNAIISGSASTVAAITSVTTDTEIHGYNIDAEGTKQRGFYGNNRANNEIYNCYFHDATQNDVYVQGDGTIVQGNLIESNSSQTSYPLFYRTICTVTDNYTVGTITLPTVGTTVTGGYGIDLTYNKFNNIYTGSFKAPYYKNTSGDDNIKFNYNHTQGTNQIAGFIYSGTLTQTGATINAKGNYWKVDSAITNASFINAFDDEDIFIDASYNTIIIDTSEFINALKAINNKGCNFFNNTIDLFTGNPIFINDVDSVANIINNNVSLRYTSSTAIGYGIGCLNNDDSTTHYGLNIYGNLLIGPKSFGESISNHAGIYVFNVKNADISKNNVKRVDIGGIIYKGSGYENDSALISYNPLDSASILIKGMRKVKIYNNESHNTQASQLGALILVDNDDFGDMGWTSDSCESYNNIWNSTYSIFEDDNDTLFSDYNVIIGLIRRDVTNYTLTQWQSLGNDLNSKSSESQKTGNGFNLGDTLNVALDTTATFPDPLTDTFGYFFDIGAYKLRSFSGDTIVKGVDTKLSQWSGKINAAVNFIPETQRPDTITLGQDSFQTWYDKANDFIQVFDPIVNDTLEYSVDSLGSWADKVNAGIKLLEP